MQEVLATLLLIVIATSMVTITVEVSINNIQGTNKIDQSKIQRIEHDINQTLENQTIYNNQSISIFYP